MDAKKRSALGPFADLPTGPESVVHIWGRLPREQDPAWATFQLFRDMAYPDGLGGRFVPRDVATLAAALGANAGGLAALALANNWEARCTAYDREVDRACQLAGMADIERVRARHLRMIGRLRLVAEKECEKLIERVNNSPGTTLKPRELIMLCDWIVKSERLLYGEATERVDLGGGIDLSKLSMAELEYLDALRVRTGENG